VQLGDAFYEKRQPNGDTHGPALRGAGLWRSVTSMIQVTAKRAGDPGRTLFTTAEPLHMSFRVGQHAQVWHIATEWSSTRNRMTGAHRLGVEDLYVTGGNVRTNNVAFCWIRNLEIDGNPGTPNIGTYNREAGISGRSLNLFHAYRCEVRDSYIHHTRNISQGGGAYLLSVSSYTSETLIENNIVVFGNKLIIGNMMGGGNVIAYNYVDNARTSHATWQESGIGLNHQAYTHSALVEGNWAVNITADTTHGNSGRHVFFRNFATGENSSPVYGPYPYTANPDGQFMRAAGGDAFTREMTYVGNVLWAGFGGRNGSYQVSDGVTYQVWNAPTVWRVGDTGAFTFDDGTALRLLYRHSNWDNVTDGIVVDEANPVRELPASLYLRAKPAFFRDADWPWVDPNGATAEDRVKVLPAKARFDAMNAGG
jgi:hypothetical protein